MKEGKKDLNEIITDELYSFMEKEKIPFVDLRYNGGNTYKIDVNLKENQRIKIEDKAKRLSKTEERINLLMKYHHGSFEKFDKKMNKSKGWSRALFKRRLKAFREVLDFIEAKESISSK